LKNVQSDGQKAGKNRPIKNQPVTEKKVKSFVFGHTEQGLPIPAYHFGASGPNVLVLGGVHGDEVEGVIASYGLLNRFSKAYSYRLQIDLVPMFNLDGVINKQRTNYNQIDLNRNLPTNDWT
jgi:protein MpaA